MAGEWEYEDEDECLETSKSSSLSAIINPFDTLLNSQNVVNGSFSEEFLPRFSFTTTDVPL